MKTRLLFLDHLSRKPSDCGEPLQIEASSSRLNWDGVVLEKGWSPYFYPENIVTPYFYFALAIDKSLNWEVRQKGGNGDSGDNGGMQILKTTPGEIWMNPPWTPFTHKIEEACFFIILAVEENIMLKSGLLKNLQRGAELQFLNNYNVSDPILENFIQIFYQEVLKAGSSGSNFFEELLKLFCNYYIYNYSNLNALLHDHSSGSFKRELMAKVDQFILENLEENITIEELAIELNMSKFHFLREFKRYTGNTPYQYIIDAKMSEAQRLLSNSGQSIAEIALALGFADQSHFSNTFKRVIGISPANFRKKAK